MIIKNILLDFGGVLYGINPQKAFQEFIRISSNPEFVKSFDLKNFVNYPMFVHYESGLIESDEFINNLKDVFSLNNDSQIVTDAWNSLLTGIFPNSIDTVKHLAQDYNIFLLSNTNQLHFQFFSRECQELFSYFKNLYLSYELKDRKPNNSIFEKVIKLSGINPQETLFVDDSSDNIFSAQALGFATLHYTSGELLSDILHTVKSNSQQI